MLRTFLISSVLGAAGLGVTYLGVPAAAQAPSQAADISPMLLLESGPSDTPGYRRAVYVKYLQGERVSVNYRALNRAEFTQMPNVTPQQVISDCARGPATTLEEIRSFERAEARRARSGQPPEIVRFCIKNVPNWEGGGRATYLDPIFNGLPLGSLNVAG